MDQTIAAYGNGAFFSAEVTDEFNAALSDDLLCFHADNTIQHPSFVHHPSTSHRSMSQPQYWTTSHCQNNTETAPSDIFGQTEERDYSCGKFRGFERKAITITPRSFGAPGQRAFQLANHPDLGIVFLSDSYFSGFDALQSEYVQGPSPCSSPAMSARQMAPPHVGAGAGSDVLTTEQPGIPLPNPPLLRSISKLSQCQLNQDQKGQEDNEIPGLDGISVAWQDSLTLDEFHPGDKQGGCLGAPDKVDATTPPSNSVAERQDEQAEQINYENAEPQKFDNLAQSLSGYAEKKQQLNWNSPPKRDILLGAKPTSPPTKRKTRSSRKRPRECKDVSPTRQGRRKAKYNGKSVPCPSQSMAVGANDVVFGRGGEANKLRKSSELFCSLVEEHSSTYSAANNPGKEQIVMSIISKVKQNGGRFFVLQSGELVQTTNAPLIQTKIRQKLRDKNILPRKMRGYTSTYNINKHHIPSKQIMGCNGENTNNSNEYNHCKVYQL
ncbi:hypothetical protein ACA910_021036 [Epithemia clementina (nom. ined.)]